ncbi:VCBS repeat-containing protein, partial [candidate division WOR-3 bacterium]|nr:VCBS repeat-containing protein [candidate division WOR-3 bacterium]
MLVAALLAQTLVSSPPGPRLDVNWTETSVADFHDGVFDPSMYASPRALLDPDSGCVEFFARFDVDNNGYFDLACADDSGPYLRIYLGSDSGYFPANCRLYPAPGGGNVDLADLDLDGRAELVHSGWRSGHVTIYWGTDSGPSMSDTTWLQISGQSEAVAVYDLDRDSYLDILAGSDNGNIYIFWGSAAGYSSARRTSVFLNGSVGHNLEVADFDRDGYGDIAASLWSRNRSAVVYWGPGRAPRTIAWLNVSANNPHGITVADLNVDGWLDIVYTGYDTVTTAYIYYGSATGFSVGNRELIHPGQCYGGGAAVAWNADKTLDLVFFRGNWNDTATWRPRVFFNRLDTTPHFSDARYIEVGDLAFNASGGFAADLNSDGYLDLFVNNMRPDTQSYILWGPTFLSYTGLPADRDHHGVWREPGSIYTRDFDAAYVSSVYDVGQDSVLGDGSCSWTALEPPGSSIGIAVRAGNTPAPDSTWTDFFGVIMNGGPLPYPVIGKRYLQYQATFIYNRPCYLPHLERISFDLYRTPAVDVAVTGILAPTGRVDSGSVVAPAVVVRNNRLGTPVASVTMRIGPAYSHALSETLGPGQTDTVFFPAWTASPLGTHAVRCSVFAELDENRANDTLGTTVEVVAVSDVGPVAIISPPALAESGSVHTPAVTVTNFGIR